MHMEESDWLISRLVKQILARLDEKKNRAVCFSLVGLFYFQTIKHRAGAHWEGSSQCHGFNKMLTLRESLERSKLHVEQS